MQPEKTDKKDEVAPKPEHGSSAKADEPSVGNVVKPSDTKDKPKAQISVESTVSHPPAKDVSQLVDHSKVDKKAPSPPAVVAQSAKQAGTSSSNSAVEPAKSKKRKLSSDSVSPTPTVVQPKPPPMQQKNLAIGQLLADYPVIQQTVRDLSSLLQLYGPLTAAQLEYNLPPVKGDRLEVKHLHDILQVLITIGLVKEVQETTRPGAEPRYSMCKVPRSEPPIDPVRICEQIELAHREMEESKARCQYLEKALESTASARSILRDLYKNYPGIVSDPVYFTALKNCHVDLGTTLASQKGPQQASATVSAKSIDSSVKSTDSQSKSHSNTESS